MAVRPMKERTMPTSKKVCSPDARTVEMTWPFRDVPLRGAAPDQGTGQVTKRKGKMGLRAGERPANRRPVAQRPESE
jgi:hypothetical protein